MFVENKYLKLYYNIILHATSRRIDVTQYYEKHHIIPKSLGGNNSNAKGCVIISPSGTHIKTDSLKIFCRENKISYWGLGEVARGKVPEYKGWKVRYL